MYLLLIVCILALFWRFLNVAFDLDNVYDMTTSLLWVLTLIVVFAGAFLGGKKEATGAAGSGASAQQ